MMRISGNCLKDNLYVKNGVIIKLSSTPRIANR
ncbi:hypothetical protein predicted by Glimmer/Critica [Salmonella enterica subsp. enterica serovar Weltevreden str. 2007-60-3289-1]|nr:hypothetical protein predicted by Glimmer/Critica [Salmonella enterica subsp. enterica serovar Weltevreden str. 2007-60-3289-1]